MSRNRYIKLKKMNYDRLSHGEQAQAYESKLQSCMDYFQFAKLVLPEKQAREVQKALANSIDNLLNVSDPLVVRVTKDNYEETRLTFAGANRPDGVYASSHGELGQIKVAYHKGENIRLSERIRFAEINTVKIITLGDALQSAERIAEADRMIKYASHMISKYGRAIPKQKLDALEHPGELAERLATGTIEIPDGVNADNTLYFLPELEPEPILQS